MNIKLEESSNRRKNKMKQKNTSHTNIIGEARKKKKKGGIEIEKEKKEEKNPTSIRFYFTNHECPEPNKNVLNEVKRSKDQGRKKRKIPKVFLYKAKHE